MQLMTLIVPMYDSSGYLIVEEFGSQLWAATSSWDTYITELRKAVHEIVVEEIGELAPSWTKGDRFTLDPAFTVGVESDAFYVSHVHDLRTHINWIEDYLSLTTTLWEYHPLAPTYTAAGVPITGFRDDVRNDRIVTQLQEAMLRCQGYFTAVGASPANARVTLEQTSEVIGL